MSNYDIKPASHAKKRLRHLQQQHHHQATLGGPNNALSPNSQGSSNSASSGTSNATTGSGGSDGGSSSNTAPVTNTSHNVETEHFILELNKDLVTTEEALSRFWDASRIHYVFGGLSLLMTSLLIHNFKYLNVKRVSQLGVRAILRNVFALQQNLLNLLPLSHHLLILSRFPEFHHHTLVYQDQHFTRIKTYAELMRYKPLELAAFRRSEPRLFTRTEYDAIEIIVKNNDLQRKEERRLRQMVQQRLMYNRPNAYTQLQQQQQRLHQQQQRNTNAVSSNTSLGNSSNGNNNHTARDKNRIRAGDRIRQEGQARLNAQREYERSGRDARLTDDDHNDNEYEYIHASDYK